MSKLWRGSRRDKTCSEGLVETRRETARRVLKSEAARDDETHTKQSFIKEKAHRFKMRSTQGKA